jgi:hypothetical protein
MRLWAGKTGSGASAMPQTSGDRAHVDPSGDRERSGEDHCRMLGLRWGWVVGHATRPPWTMNGRSLRPMPEDRRELSRCGNAVFRKAVDTRMYLYAEGAAGQGFD